MDALLGLWLCLTPVVWVLSAALYMMKREQSPSSGATAATLLGVPLWWAAYWLIQLAWQLSY
jgi:hypothetical protein